MKRIISAAVAVSGLVLVTVGLAPAAQAITNPADNPHKITVKGDDGKTYVDGHDTLPGYDDEECTYIPGAWFDFDNNKVHYADGQSITWTEWERATGYQQWQDHKDDDNGSGSGGGGGSTSTPKPPKAPSTPKSTPTKGSGSSGKPGKSHSAASGSATDGTTDEATDGATPADGSKPKTGTTKADGSKATADAQGALADEPVNGTDEVTLASGSSDESDAGSSKSGGGSAGLLILGGLFGAGLLTFAGYSVLGRSRKS
jgi:hypothetical protein